MNSKIITIRLNEEEQKWLEDVKMSIYEDNKHHCNLTLTTSETIKCLIWNYWDEYCNPNKFLLSNKSDSS